VRALAGTVERWRPSAIGFQGPLEPGPGAGTAIPHLSRISSARKSVVAVTGVQYILPCKPTGRLARKSAMRGGKVANKDTESVVSALIKQSQRLPSELYRSLTWDRGKELADHQRLTLATEVEVYFCDPRSPWQRGSNENTNRLLRQYLPRGTDLSLHSQAKLSAIARQLNERPRKTLQYQTPAEKFAECVAATS
jgi:hypothetical protein